MASEEGGVAVINGAMVGTRQGKLGTTAVVVVVGLIASCFIIPVNKAWESGGKDHTGVTTGVADPM